MLARSMRWEKDCHGLWERAPAQGSDQNWGSQVPQDLAKPQQVTARLRSPVAQPRPEGGSGQEAEAQRRPGSVEPWGHRFSLAACPASATQEKRGLLVWGAQPPSSPGSWEGEGGGRGAVG